MKAETPQLHEPVRAGRSSVVERFLDHARRSPQAVAIRERGRSWTYAELAAAASRWSVRLQEAGCRPGDVVAIDGRRGAEFLAALIGTLFARCVAMPLDPGQPQAWCLDALELAGVRMLARCPGARLPACGRSELEYDAATPGPAAAPPSVMPTPDEPAYLFFTSGTTGRPKGVLGSHGGLAHFLAWQISTFDVGPGDRVAHVTGLSFDVVLREVFVALASGACLSVPDRDTLEDPARLVRWLADEHISLLHAVPTLAGAWRAEADPALRLPALRLTFFAGEPLTRQLVVRWRELTAPGAEVINLYGPTETTLAKCWYRVPRRLPFDQIPVGQPLPECEILVLDEDGRPVPPGEPGEVVIRTRWRTLGYLSGAPAFRPNPLGDDEDDLVYPTGDRGRWLRDGSLALLGRLDDQVKIRGVRVEPAGVASVLAAHPAVAACAVLAHTDGVQPRLSAFVVASAGRSELRAYLAERLADAMVPTEFVFLPELPTTPNGKLDRLRLADLLAGPATEASASAPPPRTESERLVAGIFAELLDIPVDRSLSLHDDFFDLGGDSLQALSVISRINHGLEARACGARLNVGDLFEAPDIGGLAERLDALHGDLPGVDTAPLQPVPRDQKLPLSPVQERIRFQCLLESERPAAYNFPFAIEIRGGLDVAVLEAAVQTIRARHEILRTCFPDHDGHAVQSVRAVTPEPLRCIDLGALDADGQRAEIRRVAQAQADQPFRLAQDPPLRVLLLRCAGQRHVLLLTVHHLCFDGWSRWLLIRELGEHYTALSQGRPTADVPRIQYADYAAWRRQCAPRPDSLAYWKVSLGDAPVLDLPVGGARRAAPSCRGAQIVREIPASVLADVEALALREKATLYMALLTAFSLVLSRWTGYDDLVVGSPVANRPRPELERLMGCFLELLPVRCRLSGVRTGVDALQRVRGSVVDAFAHADVPFEKIVEHVSPPRRAGHHPFFDVMFNFVNVPQHTADPDGLALGFADWTEPEAKFDLSVYAHRKDDGLKLRLVYKAELFEAAQMTRVLDAVVEALGRLAAQPTLALAKWPMDLRDQPEPAAAAESPCGVASRPEALPSAPRDDDEATVAAVLGEVLGRDAVGVHDNFFSLGGHSLLAMQAMSRLRRLFDAELPLRLMFGCQTAAELASAIRQTLSARSGDERHGGDAAAPLTPSQLRLLRFMDDNPCSVHYNVPRKLRLHGRVDPDRLEEAINEVIARHEVLYTGYRIAGGEGVPVVRDAGHIALQRIDASGEADPAAVADRLVAEEISRPFDLGAGPLMRATLIRLRPEEHVLLVSVHHVTADCWSMGMPFGARDGSAGAWMAGVFFRELWRLYCGVPGDDATATAKGRQFGDVARRQNAWLAGPEAARQLAYWQALLADRPRALEIPPDLPRPPVWDFRGERLPLDIAPDLTAALRAFARARQTTLFVVLQAAFAVLLHERTGEEDLITGTTAANRDLWDAGEVVGFFSNNLLLRTDLGGDPDFDEIVRRSRERAFAAFAHQELPFERILESLGIAPEADRHPLFQIRFLLHLPDDAPFRNAVLSMTPEATGREVAKYDLTLLLADTGDGLTGWLEYATSLYRRDTALRLLQRYRALLPILVAHPGQRLSALRTEAS